TGPYAVGVRQLALARGMGRPLPTTVWYPAAGVAGGPAQPGAPVARGRFPVVLFSHGLHSEPGRHAALILRWAAAGFVVAAPAYPYTRAATLAFSRADVRNQPADAWYVLREVTALNERPGDAFAGHLDPDRLAAAGHSAGGFTTTGLFTPGHDPRLRAGIVIAGGGLAGAFAGPPAALLFVHGSADRVVPITLGRAAYERVPWPRAFLTMLGQGHGEYLGAGRPGFDPTAAVTTDFLRWGLYRDAAARARLAVAGTVSGVAALTTAL
ncbi:MAG TPA: alpha/beta hydrolase, partial [Pilimelia sp.]|nr:alpha/beta hydrolase [Pilimelia sp.]